MIGDLKSKATINGTVISGASIVGHVSSSCVTGSINLGKIIVTRCYHSKYDGNYIVTPSIYGESLDTKGKLMTDDVRIKPIPYYATSNLSGGYTVNIGG